MSGAEAAADMKVSIWGDGIVMGVACAPRAKRYWRVGVVLMMGSRRVRVVRTKRRSGTTGVWRRVRVEPTVVVTHLRGVNTVNPRSVSCCQAMVRAFGRLRSRRANHTGWLSAVSPGEGAEAAEGGGVAG